MKNGNYYIIAAKGPDRSLTDRKVLKCETAQQAADIAESISVHSHKIGEPREFILFNTVGVSKADANHLYQAATRH